MLYVALTLAVALVATVVSFGGVVRALVRQHARDRDLLTNQLLHAVGRDWLPAPAAEWKPPADREPLVAEWTAQPEQQPYQ